MDPSPYLMENDPDCFFPELDLLAVYTCLDLHVELVHDELGTQRSEEPVSKSMRNVWAGEPMEIEPAHSVSFSSSVSDSDWRFAMCEGRRARGLIVAPGLKTCEPTLFCRLIKFARCLLESGEGRTDQHCLCMS